MRFPERISLLIPVHHDPGQPSRARTDRIAPVEECLRSALSALDEHATANVRFRSIEIVVIDDYSVSDLADAVDPGLRARVIWLKNEGKRGQAGALNHALQHVRADAYAFTDSDCIVAANWFTVIARHYAEHPEHLGVAGPAWMFSRSGDSWTKLLTKQESALMSFLTEALIDHANGTVDRLDCRNLSLRAELLEHLPPGERLFREDGSISVSGQLSYDLKQRLAGKGRIGFAAAMQTFHAPISSFPGQLRAYFRRGRGSNFDEIYAKPYGGLLSAFRKRYGSRHFVQPLLNGVSLLYAWPVHIAFWLGIALKKLERR